MIKLNKIILFSIILISGCSNKENIFKNTQSINSFSMNIFSDIGSKLYTIKSPQSSFDNTSNIIVLKSTLIHFFKNNEIDYIINSDNSKLSNNKRLLELEGNIVIQNNPQNDDKLFANRFSWNIDDSEYFLTGDVIFENNEISLSSNKAILNKDSKIIEFFNPVKYVLKKNNNIHQINSENALYDIEAKTLNFRSIENKVRSKFTF